MKLVDSIVNRNFVEADFIISETVELIMARKLEEAKKMTAAKMSEQQGHVMNRTSSELRRLGIVEEDNELEESDDMGPVRARERVKNYKHKTSGKEISSTKHPGEEWELVKEETLDEARIKLVKARIRGGKIQRRKKVSNVPGMTIRGGKLQRMSPAERRRRKMGARKAVRKRAPKMSRALMKRKRSLMKRRALGI